MLKKHWLRSRAGLTLMELLLFSAIVSAVMIAFLGVLTSFTRVQVRQFAAAEVNQQSQFLLQTVQRYVEASSYVDMEPKDVATGTLTLWLPSSTLTLGTATTTRISLFLSSSTGPGIVYVGTSIAVASAQALTSPKVTVSNLRFVRRSHPGGKDSVDVSFVVSSYTSSTAQRFSESLSTAIARVSAATFDSDVVADANETRNLGITGTKWDSINQLIYFQGTNVGVGPSLTNPLTRLHVDGGFMLQPVASGSQPSCDAGLRGTFYMTTVGSATDTVQVCLRKGDGVNYAWIRLLIP